MVWPWFVFFKTHWNFTFSTANLLTQINSCFPVKFWSTFSVAVVCARVFPGWKLLLAEIFSCKHGTCSLLQLQLTFVQLVSARDYCCRDVDIRPAIIASRFNHFASHIQVGLRGVGRVLSISANGPRCWRGRTKLAWADCKPSSVLLLRITLTPWNTIPHPRLSLDI